MCWIDTGLALSFPEWPSEELLLARPVDQADLPLTFPSRAAGQAPLKLMAALAAAAAATTMAATTMVTTTTTTTTKSPLQYRRRK